MLIICPHNPDVLITNDGVFLCSSGLIPRLLGDVLSLWICNLLAHLINTYAIDDSVCHFFRFSSALVEGKCTEMGSEHTLLLLVHSNWSPLCTP